jgi:2-ketocyclohexanecarboxyl-CoA hydrolase
MDFQDIRVDRRGGAGWIVIDRPERSPTTPAIAKRSFNMDNAHQAGIAGLGLHGLKLYDETEESREGVRAFQAKRKPAFRQHAK